MGFFYRINITIVLWPVLTSAGFLLGTTKVTNQREMLGETCYPSTDDKYDKMLFLQGDGTNANGDLDFHYSIVDETYLSVNMVYHGIAWVGWASSLDGNMIQSTAVIGLPDEENSVSNPGKYGLTAKSPSGTILLPNQSLSNSSIVQDSTTTTLTFNKLLSENDSVDIDPNGSNIFLFGVGISNTLGYHISRGKFVLDFTDTCEGETQDSEAMEEQTTTAPDPAQIDEEECEGRSNNPDYDRMVPLRADDSLVFYYSIVDDISLSVQLLYRGTGWVAWGISPQGQMIGSEAVIGLPDDPKSSNNPGKYALSSKSASGTSLTSAQTLSNATIVQEGGITTLTFTKLLQESGEYSIDPNGVNSFIWAVGSSNSLNYHLARSSFDLDLSQACGAAPALISSPQAVPISYWKAHGILAGISWGFLTPLAISSSVHRGFSKDGAWFKAHIFLNMITVLCTIAAFGIAVVAYQKGGAKHFDGKHQTLGLAMFITVIIHCIGGVLRPHVEKDVEKTRNRRFWEMTHKLMGYFLFFASIWQVQEGLTLYAQRSGKDYKMAYWIWLIIYGVANLLLLAYTQYKKRPSA